MNKLTQFTSGRVDSLRAEIDAALKPIADKYGIKGLKLGNMKYNASQINISAMTLTLTSEDSEAAKRRMLQLSQALGFEESIFGREMYASDGNKYKVIDINTKRSKYPIIGQKCDDPSKELLFTASVRFVGEQPKKRQGNLIRFR